MLGGRVTVELSSSGSSALPAKDTDVKAGLGLGTCFLASTPGDFVTQTAPCVMPVTRSGFVHLITVCQWVALNTLGVFFFFF